MAQAKGVSVGKFLNQELNRLSETPEEKEEKRMCFVCGEKPIVEVHGASGGSIFLCERHQILKKHGRGFRELG